MSNGFLFPPTALLILLVWSSCQTTVADHQPKEKVEVYGTGAVQRRYQEIDGKKEGKMTDYYADGRLKAERWFQNDNQVGRTVLYYPGGQIKEVQYYKDGKKEGGDTLFYENGRLEFVIEYHQEKKNGYMRKWTPEGDLVIETRYVMDSLVEVKGKPFKLEYPATLKGATAK